MPAVQSAPAILAAAFEAFNQGDPEPLISAYARRDVTLVGTGAGEEHDTADAIAAALRSDGAGAVRLDWDLDPVELGADAALLTGRVSFVLPDGRIFPTRATYVLRREGTTWCIAHSHLSVGAQA